MSSLYGAKKHIFYEICNEPNGEDVHWDNAIRPYAMEVIPVIRSHDDHSVILVGTGTWSQDIHELVREPLPAWSPDDPKAVPSPLPYINTMYVFHFYANSHKQELRDRVEAVATKIPLFCTEWGTTGNTGLSGFNPEESTKWMQLLNKYGISWCNWAFWAAQDDCAALNIWKLKAGTLQSGEIPDKMLTPSGKFVKSWVTNNSY